jgi:hypothetical protein
MLIAVALSAAAVWWNFRFLDVARSITVCAVRYFLTGSGVMLAHSCRMNH